MCLGEKRQRNSLPEQSYATSELSVLSGFKGFKRISYKKYFSAAPVSLAPENTLCISLSPLCDWIKVTEELSESSEGVRYFRIKGLKTQKL